MTALGNLNAGSRLTASEARAVAPLAAYKGADETITSSTTLQNDDALFVPVLANAVYFFSLYADFEGFTTGSGDLKWGWTFPTGLTMRYQQIGNAGGALTASVGASYIQTTVGSNASDGATVLQAVTLQGTVSVSSTPGTLQWQWAQLHSSSTPTIVHAGSAFVLWQIA